MLRRIGRISFPFPVKTTSTTFLPTSSSSSSSSSFVSTIAGRNRQLHRPPENVFHSSISIQSPILPSPCSLRMYSVLSSGLRGNMSVLGHVMKKCGQQHRTYNPCAKFKNKSQRKATGNKKCRNLKPKQAAVTRFLKTAYGLKHGRAGTYIYVYVYTCLCMI